VKVNVKNFAKNLATVVVLLLAACTSAPIRTPMQADVAAWQQRAKAVTIIRDDWGVPHIYAKTDADVVFGLMYAQAEDDAAGLGWQFGIGERACRRPTSLRHVSASPRSLSGARRWR
jgi:acyl-homoserine lactone acylase PvdQ